MIDTVRGVLRVRKWPKKRGTPTSTRQLFWIDWFRQANRLAKYVDAASAYRAIELTAKSGLYPRDLLLAAMRGRLYHWADETGWKWYSMAAIGDISESLDVLAQTVGDVLVRAADRWRAPPPGNLDDVLLNKGPGNAPAWGPVGIVTENVSGTPLAVDGTKNLYTFDVSAYASVLVLFNSIGFAAADRAAIRFSADGGLTYLAGPNDYTDTFLLSASSGTTNRDQIETSAADAAGGHIMQANLMSLRANGASVQLMAGIGGGDTVARGVVANFFVPVTNIQIRSIAGNNFNVGVINAIGTR